MYCVCCGESITIGFKSNKYCSLFCATSYQAIRLSHINNKPIPMTELEIIRQRTISTIDTNIIELKKLLGETKLNLQLSSTDKVKRISTINDNLRTQINTRTEYVSLMNNVKVKF